MLADLSALAPSLIVAAGFLIGVYLLLRRELAPRRSRRRARSDADRGAGANFAADIPAGRNISGQEDAAPDTSSDDEQSADQPRGTRSHG